jgi:GDP-4-dehydro-6-deoxy-D-mannose reductase
VIYHLAALSIPADCGCHRPTDEATAVNVEGTARVINLADWLCDSQPVPPRLLFVGSSHVYRPVSVESPRVDETAPLEPISGYGQTKLEAERLALRAAERGRFEAVIARAFQHTGPRQSPRMMLPQWASQLAQLEEATSDDRPIEIYTKDALIDISDVRDVVRAYRLLAQQGRNGEVYNVGSGIVRRSGDLLNLLMQIGGSRRPVVELRPGAKQDPIADISRLQSETAWQQEIPVEKTVEQTLQYWRDKIRSSAS